MNRKSFDFDPVSLALYIILAVGGWMTVYAVTSVSAGDYTNWLSMPHWRQLIWLGISLVAGAIVLLLDYRFIEALGYLFYILAIGLLILTVFIGREINGAKAWIVLGGQQFQPSEFAKLATAMALAQYMSRQGFSMNDNRQLFTAISFVLLPALIVILQNDTGSALVFGSFLIVFYREGLTPLIPLGLLISVAVVILSLWINNGLITGGIMLGIGLISFIIFFNRRYWIRIATIHLVICGMFVALASGTTFIVSKLQPHQQIRIKVLLDPTLDPQGAGYNVIQSKIAIGSGGSTGKGFLNGNYTKYKFVPKQETDFIYCTVGEEYGWIGSSTVLLLFLGLIWRIQYMAESAKTRYARIYGYSVASILFFHVMVNVGMTIGLVPVIGIPLPFFSYGGSSLLSFTVLIFVLINLYSYRVSVLGMKR
ncbi:MAG: rod shape-determining protein RodA [Bacteroidia bacterium]|nr:rod shape-determining protein RodA [Bacteroidia bacterium]